MNEKLISWGRLLRLPNLFTVPGDPLVGFLVVTEGQVDVVLGKKLILVMLSSIFVYLYGLVSNDIADLDEDTRDRPKRPLPSGAIALSTAKIAAAVFVVVALALAYGAGLHAFVFALILVVLVSFYNFSFKSHLVFGPLLLGLCRISSILLGAAAVSGAEVNVQPLYFVLPTVFFYIYGVSEVAKSETETLSHRRGRAPMCVAVLIVILTVMFFGFILFNIPQGAAVDSTSIIVGILLYLFFAGITFKYVLLFTRQQQPAVIQRSIGALIRNLMFFQAAWCAFSGSPIIAAIIVLLSYNAKIASKKFYGS